MKPSLIFKYCSYSCLIASIAFVASLRITLVLIWNSFTILPLHRGKQVTDHTPLPIYWIDNEKSTSLKVSQQNDSAIKMFSKIKDLGSGIRPVRIIGMEESQFMRMLHKQLFETSGITFVPMDNRKSKDRYEKGEYFYEEGASLLSHLLAIQRAYNDGFEMALIMEDTITLEDDFVLHWYSYMKLAPTNWDVLQLMSSNSSIQKHLSEIRYDPWINWYPFHQSDSAYLISRNGMRQILEQTLSKKFARDKWHIQNWKMLLPHEVINCEVKNVYIATNFPGIVGLEGTSKSVPTARNTEHHSWILSQSTLRPERILLLTTYRIDSAEKLNKVEESLNQDVIALSNSHKEFNLAVKAIVTDDNQVESIEKKLQFHPAIILSIEVSQTIISKFMLIRSFMSQMDQYDYVVLKDGDMKLLGFPWNTFFHKKGNAFISGVPRTSIRESFVRHNSGHREYFLNNIHGWIDDDVVVEEFLSVTPVLVPFIEQYFTVIRGDFAKWYFSQILSRPFVSSKSSWGPDLMWCGAAYAYNATTPSCYLIPLPMVHGDTKSIRSSFLSAKDLQSQGRDATSNYSNSKLFTSWGKASLPYMQLDGKRKAIMPGHGNGKILQSVCGTTNVERTINLTKCLTPVMNFKK